LISRRTSLLILAAVVGGVGVWRFWLPDDRRDVRRRLNAFAAEFNESTAAGLATVAHAARIGTYFTDDVVLELGDGAPPIRGRQTLIAMATRLQPRAAAFRLDLVDQLVTISSPATADVSLTAAFRRRSTASGEESLEAQELTVRMVKLDGTWLVSEVRSVEAFK
jgi:SnoaL-like protein